MNTRQQHQPHPEVEFMVATGIERIAGRASRATGTVFNALMPHYTVENLQACFQSLENHQAAGIDGVTKTEYGQKLEENLQDLHRKLRQQSYRPQAVRRVEIPKADGRMRPLGISCVEDKIVQEMTRRILEAIYEPVFYHHSYGFRPHRGCHDALRQLHQAMMTQPVNWIADLDLAQFFDTMSHSEILKVLNQRIGDNRFLQLIARMLKAGVQTPHGNVREEMGSPQGSIASPVIANVLLDVVLDQWFATIVSQHCRGYCLLIRYADDSIALFEFEDDARRFMRVLPKRLEKFGLRLNEEKTQLLQCGKRQAWQALKRGERLPTFDFLGFTHYWGKSRQGRSRLMRKTSKQRFGGALVALNQWLHQQRNVQKLPALWEAIGQKLRGHFNYFGVTDNGRALYRFEDAAHKLIFKWLNRRSQRRSFTWERFRRYLAWHPLPRPRRLVSLY